MKRIVVFFIVLSFITGVLNTSSAHYGAKYEPPDGKTIHGLGWHGASQDAYMEMMPDTLQPLIFQMMKDVPGISGRGGLTVTNLLAAFRAENINQRTQFVEWSFHFRDDGVVIDREFADTREYDGYIDTVAIALREYGRPVFIRPGLEMNGNWNGYHPYIFPRAYRKFVEGLRRRGVDNFATVWCYEPDAAADFADSTDRGGWKWYPGDDVVDWFGLDPFDADHFDPAGPDSIDRGGQWVLTKKGKSEKFLSFAEAREKPVYLNELSARHVWITPHDEEVDSTHGEVDWNYWFAPFFEFMENHPNIKGFNYINLDWTQIGRWETWGDARLEINEYIRDMWIKEISSERYLNAGYNIDSEVSVPDNSVSQPADFSVTTYPNPFNSSFRISYSLTNRSDIIFTIYSLKGETIQSIKLKGQSAGHSEMLVDCSDLTSGVYLLAVNNGKFSVTDKIVLIR
ncbi:MAG: T9SS type A sorting domain-containing protein [Calditrichaeota bacterium]|nr:T9SS type A sorting domain-containing protein [Calditrichota bacterium]